MHTTAETYLELSTNAVVLTASGVSCEDARVEVGRPRLVVGHAGHSHVLCKRRQVCVCDRGAMMPRKLVKAWSKGTKMVMSRK